MNRLNDSRRSRRQGLNGAALVDDQGREIPITEAMILRACGQAIDTCVASQYRAMQETHRRGGWAQAQGA